MNAINTNEQMIQKINEVLQTKKDAVVNIVNGTSVEDALQEAQDTLAFKMTE